MTVPIIIFVGILVFVSAGLVIVGLENVRLHRRVENDSQRIARQQTLIKEWESLYDNEYHLRKSWERLCLKNLKEGIKKAATGE